MAEFDRTESLEQIKIALGFTERDDDEFTAKEIAKCFNVSPTSVIAFFDLNEVKYKRRKAIADGRRVYVYRVIISN